MPEAFSAERFKKIMELRGAGVSKSAASDSIPPQNRPLNQVRHEAADRVETLNAGLRELQQENRAQSGGNVLPEVTIIGQKKQQYFSLRYEPNATPNYLGVSSQPNLYTVEYLESYIDDYLQECQKYREDCLSPKVADMRQNDENLLKMINSALDLRLERLSIGMECRANKLSDLGLKMEDVADGYDDINSAEGEKVCVKEMKKIGKKLSGFAKSSVKIGKKQLKIADEEMTEINEVHAVLQSELGLKEGLGLDEEDFMGEIQLSASARDKLFKFVNETYKMAGKDLSYCQQAEREVKSLKNFNLTDGMKVQQTLLDNLSR